MAKWMKAVNCSASDSVIVDRGSSFRCQLTLAGDAEDGEFGIQPFSDSAEDVRTVPEESAPQREI